jgi:CarD family transcriptional regulator
MEERCVFEIGDTVVCPHHGAGEVIDVSRREHAGQATPYLTIKIIHSDLTVMVPVENAERAGIRSCIPEQIVEEVIGVLRDDPTKMPKNWNRRYKHNREKIKSGDVFEVADVVRNLALLDAAKGLSTGEKQMFGRVKRILASEFMYAKQLPEDDALSYLEQILKEICTEAAE